MLADSPEISKNILVFVTEDAKALTDLGDEMEENLGTYLEGMLQGNPDMVRPASGYSGNYLE